MQPVYGKREQRAARRALRLEAWRAVLTDLATIAFAIGLMLAAGAFGGAR